MIEPVSNENINELLPLIRKYQEFYKVENISDSRNKEFFSRFGEDNPSGCQFLFRQENHVVGFATVYFTYTSTIAAKVAVMNDLFVVKEMRRKGVGRRLVEHCHEYARDRGAARLQWITAAENVNAQLLYNSINVDKSNWLLSKIPT